MNLTDRREEATDGTLAAQIQELEQQVMTAQLEREGARTKYFNEMQGWKHRAEKAETALTQARQQHAALEAEKETWNAERRNFLRNIFEHAAAREAAEKALAPLQPDPPAPPQRIEQLRAVLAEAAYASNDTHDWCTRCYKPRLVPHEADCPVGIALAEQP